MSSGVRSDVWVDVDASNFAFRIGQWAEQLLLDRSVRLATESGSPVVTVEHVESCLDHALFDELLERVRENPHERTAVAGGVCDRDPREAA